jgi:glycosyltransferase involved in cell wall biosynthesis
MKVLISSAYYSPHISGLTNHIRNLAELFAENNITPTVLTTQHLRSLPQQETIQKVSIVRVPYVLKISKGFLMPSYVSTAFREIHKADQVLINLPQAEGFLVALIAKLLRKKVHSIYVCEVTLQGGFVTKMVENILRILNTLCSKLSDTVITLTEDFASSTAVLVHNPKQVIVIPPVIRIPEIDTVAKKILLQKIEKRDAVLIGFLGRMSSEKGIEYLLDTIPRLKKHLTDHFYIVLAGPEKVVGERGYQKRIAVSLEKYKDHVIRLGELQDDELGAFYSLLDVLVLPSINSTEVFGMVQVEAMLCGTPTVASDLPGVRTIVQQTGMGEIAKRKNAKDLADKIVEVVKYRKSYTKQKKEVEMLYDTRIVLEKYREVFDRGR